MIYRAIFTYRDFTGGDETSAILGCANRQYQQGVKLTSVIHFRPHLRANIHQFYLIIVFYHTLKELQIKVPYLQSFKIRNSFAKQSFTPTLQ